MKRAYLIFWISCLAFMTAGAQGFVEDDEIPSTALDRVQAQRAAFITEKIDMTSQEAEKFWPVFNEYEDEERRIRKRYLQGRRIINMSDAEARKFIESRFEMEQELLDLKRKYFLRLADIISPRKLANFNRADREFKKLLLNRIRSNQRRGRN